MKYFVFVNLVLGLLMGQGFAHDGDHPLHHWEVATPDPDRIFLCFNGDPATSRAVSWRTDSSIKVAYAEIAEATESASFAQFGSRGKATTQSLNLKRFTGNTQQPVHYHSAVFRGLKPETTYVYRVGDGEEHWSEWIQFRTASKKNKAFSFTYYGDAQNEILKYWSRLIRQSYQTAPHASFAIHAGDLVNHAHADVEWAEWFKAGSFIHSQWTGVPVTGNHEYTDLPGSEPGKTVSMQWRPQFALPVVKSLPKLLHETVYSFGYQGMQVVVLNSSHSIKAQTPYLEQELQKPGFRWRCVVYHHSLFSPVGRNTDEHKLMMAQWVPLFEKYNVDMVLQGHDHSYVRSKMPVRHSEAADGQVQTVYVTSVSGPKQYPIDPMQLNSHAQNQGPVTSRVGEHTQLFHVIDVDGNTLTFKAYTATGKLYDAMTLTKNFETGTKTLKEQVPNLPARMFSNTEPYTFVKEREAIEAKLNAE